MSINMNKINLKNINQSNKVFRVFFGVLSRVLFRAIVVICYSGCFFYLPVSYAQNLRSAYNINRVIQTQTQKRNNIIDSSKGLASYYRSFENQNVRQYQPLVKQFQKIAAQQNSNMHFSAEHRKQIPPAMVFISFGMPPRTLKRTLYEARILHIPVILRGLIHNSFKDTVAAVFELTKQKNIGVRATQLRCAD